MTGKQLSRANKLHEKIIKTEKIINDLQNGYMNSINTVSFRGGKEDSLHVVFSKDDELHSIIINYFQNQLSVLQKEFEKS